MRTPAEFPTAMDRTLRMAPAQADFDARKIPFTNLRTLATKDWFRLARKGYPSHFYPSPGSRLTPDSRDFPCVYLGASLETTVAEVWGDRLAAQGASGKSWYVISSAQALDWEFVRPGQLPEDLHICDLTQSNTLLAIGIDSGALYSPDLSVPQAWATRIARHPANFDGIHYHSRHTCEPCLVLWTRSGAEIPLENRVDFTPCGEFLNAHDAYILAGKIGVRLSFIEP